MTGSDETPYRGRRILVLGAAGFIGRRVVRMLERQGAMVIRAVHRADPTPRCSRTVVVDLSVPGTAAALVEAEQPEVTFNLAGYGVLPTQRDPGQAQLLNADLPAELAVACATERVPNWQGPRLVHTGSALEYGVAAGNLAEDTLPLPTTLYGRTKLAGTTAIAAAVAAGGLRAVTARLFTVYGPGEPLPRLLPSLRAAAGATGAIALTSGEQQRDFTYVDDVAEGILRLGMSGAAAGTVNLATGILTPVATVVRLAAAQFGIAAERLRFGALPTRPEEMSHQPVALDRLWEMTGWVPQTTIAEGLRRTHQEDAPSA